MQMHDQLSREDTWVPVVVVGGPRGINFSLAICMTLIVKWRDVVVSLNLHLTDDGKLNSPAQCQLPLSGDLFLGTLQ